MQVAEEYCSPNTILGAEAKVLAMLLCSLIAPLPASEAMQARRPEASHYISLLQDSPAFMIADVQYDRRSGRPASKLEEESAKSRVVE